jgi:hypothetical protein
VRKFRILLVCFLLLAIGLAVFGIVLARQSAKNRVRLADGSSLALKQVILTAEKHSYAHESRGPIWNLIAPILPEAVRKKIPANRASFGFGSDGNTNLILVTELRHALRGDGSSVNRLRVSDGTNVYDACWGAHTLGLGSETVNGWQVRAFPRRARELTLEFLSQGPKPGHWAIAGTFNIANPAFSEFSQWAPGPTVQTNDNLVVHLEKFRSGERMDETPEADSRTAARKTEMLFRFEENGRATEDWRVQKVILSDATGNRWFPYLNLVKHNFTWAKGGQVEMFGALWPGEAAWKLDVEAVRIKGVPPEDLFHLETTMPDPGTVLALTNVWKHDGVTVKFVALASPNTDHTGDLKWTGKWWGEDKDKVYSLVLETEPEMKGQRLQLVSALDQGGREVGIQEHRGQDDSRQAIFLYPEKNAESLTLTFSLTRSRFVQFMARPEFVTP